MGAAVRSIPFGTPGSCGPRGRVAPPCRASGSRGRVAPGPAVRLACVNGTRATAATTAQVAPAGRVRGGLAPLDGGRVHKSVAPTVPMYRCPRRAGTILHRPLDGAGHVGFSPGAYARTASARHQGQPPGTATGGSHRGTPPGTQHGPHPIPVLRDQPPPGAVNSASFPVKAEPCWIGRRNTRSTQYGASRTGIPAELTVSDARPAGRRPPRRRLMPRPPFPCVTRARETVGKLHRPARPSEPVAGFLRWTGPDVCRLPRPGRPRLRPE